MTSVEGRPGRGGDDADADSPPAARRTADRHRRRRRGRSGRLTGAPRRRPRASEVGGEPRVGRGAPPRFGLRRGRRADGNRVATAVPGRAEEGYRGPGRHTRRHDRAPQPRLVLPQHRCLSGEQRLRWVRPAARADRNAARRRHRAPFQFRPSPGGSSCPRGFPAPPPAVQPNGTRARCDSRCAVAAPDSEVAPDSRRAAMRLMKPRWGIVTVTPWRVARVVP
jgi:hypothetical protein